MNVLVIGLGSMGKRRIRNLLLLFKSSDIIGVDKKPQNCFDASKQFSIECTGSIDDALTNMHIDAAFVCTSPLSHVTISCQLLKKGIHVFSEINLVSEQYEMITALEKENHALYFLSSTPMYRDEMRYLIAVTSGEKNLTYNYHVGQYLPDWHPWENYSDFFVGNKETNGCREIFAIEMPWILKAFGDIVDISVSRKKSTTLNIDYDDTYIVTLTHENGNSGVFCVDLCCRKPVRSLEVYNQNIYIQWGGSSDSLFRYDLEQKQMVDIEPLSTDEHNSDYAYFVNEKAYFSEMQCFFDCINGISAPKHDLKTDKKVLDIIDRIEGRKR